MSMIIGAIISLVVRFLIKIPFIKDHPKSIAGTLSALAAIVVAWCSKCGTIADSLTQLASQIGAIALAAATSYATAVATHETVIKKVLGPVNSGTAAPAGVKLPEVVSSALPSNPLQGGR